MLATRQGSPGRGVARRIAGPALAAAALLGALGAAQAQKQPLRDDLQHVSVEDLKRGYLACHEASMRRILDMGEAMQGSVVYEAFKQRAVGGDFGRMLAWTHAQTPRAAAERANPPRVVVP